MHHVLSIPVSNITPGTKTPCRSLERAATIFLVTAVAANLFDAIRGDFFNRCKVAVDDFFDGLDFVILILRLNATA
jgi:hypothetical protein